MIKTLLLIFEPLTTWERIFRAQRSLVYVSLVFLFPLLLITSAGEGYGLIHWGKWQSEIGRMKFFSQEEAIAYEIAQCLLSIMVVFLGAKLMKSMAETFHGRHNFRQAFTTVAYGLSPLFMLRLLDIFPIVSPWVSWSIGIMLSIGVLYQGVPRMMEPDPVHAFGLYLMSSLLLLLATGLLRFVTAWYLAGKFTKVHAIFPT
jgi:Yip1 domain